MRKIFLLLLAALSACQKSDRDPPMAIGDTPVLATSDTIDQDDQYQRTLTEDDRDKLERHYPFTLKRIDEHKSLSVQDIKNLTRAGISDEVIAYLIHFTNSNYYLTPKEEQDLKQSGVSNHIIETMRQTTNTIGQL